MGRKVYIEIGTCDFDTCLDFSEAGWMGYMIEANPIHAAAMRIQCKNNDTEVHNLAISDYNGHIDLLTPKPELDSAGNEYEWQKGISHVVSDNHKGSFLLNDPSNDKIRGDIVRVPCMTLTDFVESSSIDRIDFMKIDVEGHEVNVMEGYDWKVKPTLVKIEHAHCDEKPIISILEDNGYKVWVEFSDVYGVLIK
jgi:FkbM family methyltransferase